MMEETKPANQQLILAIESSCDETAAAIIDQELNVLSSVVASQAEMHSIYGGVVPEIASRAHVQQIIPVIDQAIKQADKTLNDLSAIAVVTEPGLVGSLLVGLTAAKSLSLMLDIPLIAVNHIEAPLYACRMAAGRDIFPAIGLVVSGGHSNIYDCKSAVNYELIGSTIDDAAGEAFDKTAHILNLPYPGGPSIQKAARNGNPKAFSFPRPMIHSPDLDFSFSGLKTAVLYEVKGKPGKNETPPELTDKRVADISASFQAAVTDLLVKKCQKALKQTGYIRLCLGGGVAANQSLRDRLKEICASLKIELFIAPMEYCTDNAAMAAIAWEHHANGQFAPLDIDVNPGLVRRRS